MNFDHYKTFESEIKRIQENYSSVYINAVINALKRYFNNFAYPRDYPRSFTYRERESIIINYALFMSLSQEIAKDINDNEFQENMEKCSEMIEMIESVHWGKYFINNCIGHELSPGAKEFFAYHINMLQSHQIYLHNFRS